jgi:SAM-dependent methyltransferase
MRQAWAADIDLRARAHWTEARTRGLLGSKHLILPPADYGPLLRAIGLLKADASMGPESVRKYMQISHMLTLLEPQLRDLAREHSVVRLVDLACGNSYLTFTMATSFARRIGHPAQILGVDRNERLIDGCRERASRLGLEEILRFDTAVLEQLALEQAWQKSYGRPPERPIAHMLVALHACDTATDDALAIGLSWGVPSMAVVPCCQAELAKRWSAMGPDEGKGPLRSIWQWPHMRRETGATMTDALRALLLRGCGYDVSLLEFVPTTHTAKNTMLRAVRRTGPNAEAFSEYLALRESLDAHGLRLEAVLPEPYRTQLRAAEAARTG